jgi:protein-L-isoaspartate(D-aspartate) O-methyltransferase
MQPREPTQPNTTGAPVPPETEQAVPGAAGPAAARARLASELRHHGHPLSPSVLRAFEQVPRHMFVPEIGAAAAYRDEAFVIKCGPDGLPVSSSSQPAMMAIMLDQLDLRPGHRVLEIGTGTGYNAAVMSAVVGAGGEVVSIDIDPELAARARASLLATGFDTVTVRCADGGYGDPAGAPFDRVIVTAGAWDIAPAWLDQLGPGGRLVLPLSIRGIQLSLALQRAGACWLSTSAWRCGFVRMLGAFAGPEAVVQLEEPSALVFQISDGGPVDAAALVATLAGEPTDVAVEVPLAGAAELADLDLWLTMTAGPMDRLTVLAASGSWLRQTPLPPFGGLIDGAQQAGAMSIAMLLPAELAPDPGVPIQADSWSGALLRGFGPRGAELATTLADRAVRWADLGRPGARALEIAVWPAAARSSPPSCDWLVLDRPSVRVAAGWPG